MGPHGSTLVHMGPNGSTWVHTPATTADKDGKSGTISHPLLGDAAASKKNAILDGCSTVDSTLDFDGIGWYSMVLHGMRWYFAIE